ncbi:MAG: protease inhibitor I42 family protein [Chitinophagaceae bacterium]|nr:protease inhibitor I42 family protein [Chitinophagaceae bacterium]MBK8953427.1 protease inhibitor I42 family protein [Chitinophagaceae bacterium]
MKILVLLLTITGLYCTEPASTTFKPGSNEMTDGKEIHNQKPDTIETKTGNEFGIKLRAALGTGNRWMLEDSLDKDYLTLISSNTITDSTEMAGKPDLQTFIFKAVKPGTANISFVYKRPWRKITEANAERKLFYIKIN